jgi:hypothetical protein
LKPRAPRDRGLPNRTSGSAAAPVNIRKICKRAVSSIARLATGRNTNVKLVEPPSCNSPSAIVFIGRNRRGQWVAQEQNGLYGGLFVSRAQAVKYALFENGHHPETIVELTREIELDMGGAPIVSSAGAVHRVA